MRVRDFVIEDLMKVHGLIQIVDDALFVEELSVLSNASIGQHVRHILEFYKAVIDRPKTAEVNYDNRQRNRELEMSRQKATDLVSQLQLNVSQHKIDEPLFLTANYAATSEEPLQFTSSFQRELAYALEHSIHHQAIIKIGLYSKPFKKELIHTLGLSPATLRFRQKEIPNS
jgi:uncharacterized damage-inducible protein DinB